MSQICRFYQMGTCKFGDSCRYEHPGASRSQNRYSGFSSGGTTMSGSNRSLPYQLSKEAIEKDLTTDAPQWILSAYGPGKDAPEQLFGGYPREQSTEEIRWHYEKSKAEGKEQQALSEIQSLYENAKQQMQSALGNLDNATKFVVDGINKHPNRIDVATQSNPPGGTTGEFGVGKRAVGGAQSSSSSSNPFGGGASSAFGSGGSTGAFGQPSSMGSGSAFGQPSAIGAKPSPFGTPAFGQASQPSAGSAFGKPSQLGSTSSAFGQPSAMGAKPSAFGGSAFGSGGTSAFGQAGQPSGGAFGQPSQMGSTGSGFGQPSSMGAKPSPFGTPAFGQPSQPATGGSAFGQPSQLGSTPSAFGQASAMGAKPSPFGSTAATGASTGASPFSAFSGNTNTGASSSPSPFAAQAQTQSQNTSMGGTDGGSTPFGQKPSPFGGASQPATSSPFGQPSQPATSSPFGQPSQPAASTSTSTSNPFGGGSTQNQSAPNPFAKPQQNGFPPTATDSQPSGFGQKASPFAQQTQSPFGQPSQQPSQPSSNPFSQAAQPPQPPQPTPAAAAATVMKPTDGFGHPYPPGSGKEHPQVSEYVNLPAGTWKGRPIEIMNDAPGYRNQLNQWIRIWFPKGAPNYYSETELPDSAYDERTKSQWEAFERTGVFEGGLVPELPPKRVHCRWDI